MSVPARESEDPPPISDQSTPADRGAEHDVTLLAPAAWKYCVAMGSASWILFLLFLWFSGGPIGPRDLLHGGLAFLLAVVPASYIRNMFALRVSAEGMTARSSLGRPTAIPWTEPHAVSVRRLAGVLHLEVSAPRVRSPLRVPLLKLEAAQLLTAVRRHARNRETVTAYEHALGPLLRPGSPRG